MEGYWGGRLGGSRSLLESGHLGSSDLESYWVLMSEEGGKEIRDLKIREEGLEEGHRPP